ncbi:MAG TPA: hypothetical protein PKH68_05335 [Paludibacteraceae bacterium]|jgi:hypothetical protein|nr:hypothetical protein [Paludibacteraceae bacterium]
MNKIFYIISAFILVALFSACEPIVNPVDMGTIITSADELQATVTPVMDGTKKTNKVIVSCTSPVSCQWTDGVKTYTSNNTEMILFVPGDIEITLKAMAADGTVLTKKFTTKVDEIKFPVEPQYGYFCGSGVKTWVWAVDNTYTGPQRIWGNGNSISSGVPNWWGKSAADAEPDIDLTAKMTFTLNGLKFSRTERGVTTTGNFSFDMGSHKASTSIGSVTFIGTTIPHGIAQNNGQKVVYTFDIKKLTNDEMILMYPTDPFTPGNDSEGWFWLFKREGFTY